MILSLMTLSLAWVFLDLVGVIRSGYTSAVYLYLRSILTAGAVGVVFTDLFLSLHPLDLASPRDFVLYE